MFQSVVSAFQVADLRRKILVTIGLLVIYRLVANIPVPGVDVQQWLAFTQDGTGLEGLLGVLNLLSGGAVGNFSVLSMGVYPYITASIIMQLLTPVIPYLEELSQEGESGRNRINRFTYYLTVPLALIQAVGQINLVGLQFGGGAALGQIMPNFGFSEAANIVPTLVTLLAMTAGTMFAIWLGEQITESGVGQGISLIIFGGIASQVPLNLLGLIVSTENATGDRIISLVAFLVITVITVLVIVYIQEGERRIPVRYSRRIRGSKVYQGQSTHLPVKVNTAGMIPIIFASSIMTFPSLIASFFIPAGSTPDTDGPGVAFARTMAQGFNQGADIEIYRFAPAFYWFFLFIFVAAFTFFYTNVMMQQQKMGRSLHQRGGFIPGIKPGDKGKRTDEYINKVVSRITFVGAVYLGIVAILPGIMAYIAWAVGINGLSQSALIINGSGMIIIVGVIIDTMRQIEAQLVMRSYEG